MPAWTSRFFSEAEMRCKCGCGRADMNPAFMAKLDTLRAVYGAPLVVTSGFRCSNHNQAVSHTGTDGPHTTGRAVDFAISRGPALKLLKLALESNFFSGFGIDQEGDSRFLHLDDLPNADGQPRPTLWSY